MVTSLVDSLSQSADSAREAVAPIGTWLRQAAGVGAAAGPRYSAFLSYSHADADFARWLHKALETYRLPKALVGTAGERGPVPAKLKPVFRDEEELAGAAELGPRLIGALDEAEALVVICSPRAARSRWVDTEIRTFKTRHPDRPVFAVIARGVPGDPEEECFPEPLRYALGADGACDSARPLEPLAPDAQKLDRGVVKLKLIAGLLGIGYGVLNDREHKRARKRAAAVASFSTVLIVVLSLLSIAAVSYARVAVHERKRAEVQRNAAIKARDLAVRRAWLAQRAAQEVRFLTESANCPAR